MLVLFCIFSGEANSVVVNVISISGGTLTLTNAANFSEQRNSEVTLQLNSAAVTFTADNWYHEVTVNIESDDDFYTD